VTSAYQIYRAQRLFEKQGFEVVDYKSGRRKTTTILNFLPNGNNLKLTETGIREIIGRIFYLLKS